MANEKFYKHEDEGLPSEIMLVMSEDVEFKEIFNPLGGVANPITDTDWELLLVDGSAPKFITIGFNLKAGAGTDKLLKALQKNSLINLAYHYKSNGLVNFYKISDKGGFNVKDFLEYAAMEWVDKDKGHALVMDHFL